MVRNVLAVLVGFAAWMAGGVATNYVAISIWRFSPDKIASIAVIAFVGTALGLSFAAALKEKIAPDLGPRYFIGVLAVIVLFWVSSSLLSGIDVEYKLAALGAHAVACISVFSQARRFA